MKTDTLIILSGVLFCGLGLGLQITDQSAPWFLLSVISLGLSTLSAFFVGRKL